jgi:hypothetical protein
MLIKDEFLLVLRDIFISSSYRLIHRTKAIGRLVVDGALTIGFIGSCFRVRTAYYKTNAYSVCLRVRADPAI